MRKLLLLTLPMLIAAAATPALAKPAHLKWMAGPPGVPAGATFAVVSGDPSKDGMFTVRIKLPANYVVPPHHHPTDEKVGVVDGTLSYGMGDKLNKAAAGTLNKGYHITMQAGMNHWVYTSDAGATIYITAMGPFAITYVDPKDDPRTK